jgi:hypothetical protein
LLRLAWGAIMLRGRKVREGGWYVKKPYAHFDQPLTFDIARARVSDPAYVASRSYWPFIGFTDKKRRFRKKDGKPLVDEKKRPLRYCSHHDGYIHSFYAFNLSNKYESFIRSRGISDVVLAYRKGLGTNVKMAKAAFREIERRGSCCVIALDIESFFDSIDHAVLKRNLCEVLSVERLSPDWFSVLKSMTRYSWVELEKLASRLKFDPEMAPRPLCTASEYRTLVRVPGSSLIEVNRKPYGIPQGSPISAVLSNIYMVQFDLTCHAYFTESGIYYRRYSDDIIIICDASQLADVNKFIDAEIAKLGPSMKISTDKTVISEFKEIASGGFVCDMPVTYLGFTFDGRRTALRARTLSRYYRRMTYATRAALRSAKRASSKQVYLRRLYRDLTHLGQQNFYSYVRKASHTMDDFTPVRQLRRHFRILHRKLKSRGR